MDSPLILSLDAHGVPHRWISWQQACFYYAKNLVAWTMGDETFTYYGGISRLTGERSSITAHSIIAIKGKALAAKGFHQVPPLNNRELFRRDRHMCAYCGGEFSYFRLTRDHITPLSRGGRDTWMNVVTACRHCNGSKRNRRNSGFYLLERDPAGRLRVTDDFLRAYYLRPEVHPVEESCDAERALHAALMENPRRTVSNEELTALKDKDAEDNYRTVLSFRDRLVREGTVEALYVNLFKGKVDIPPLFIEQLAHVILRNILDGCDDPLRLRAGELFFRDQKATLQEGHVLLADLETVEMHAAGNRYGSVGRLIVEAQGSLGSVDLDVLDRANAALYWERESRHDTVISLTYGRPALDAYCRVIEAWVSHFTKAEISVKPIRKIEEQRWAWHVGLDAESTSILNELWSGGEVDQGRMRRIIALFALQFEDPAVMRPDLSGRIVYLGLAATEEGLVRMKPQNLLLNLPLHGLSS